MSTLDELIQQEELEWILSKIEEMPQQRRKVVKAWLEVGRTKQGFANDVARLTGLANQSVHGHIHAAIRWLQVRMVHEGHERLRLGHKRI